MAEINDLKKLEIFRMFSEKQLLEFARITEKTFFKKGAQVYRRGNRANPIFLVNKGLVRLRKNPQEYTLSAVCLEDSEIMVIDADKLFELCKHNPELVYNFLIAYDQINFEQDNYYERQ